MFAPLPPTDASLRFVATRIVRLRLSSHDAVVRARDECRATRRSASPGAPAFKDPFPKHFHCDDNDRGRKETITDPQSRSRPFTKNMNSHDAKNHAQRYIDQRRLGKALQCLHKVLALQKKLYGRRNMKTACTLDLLGCTLFNMGEVH